MKNMLVTLPALRKKRKAALLSAVAGALVLLSSSWALALELPTMTVTIGGEAIAVTPNWNYDAVKDQYTLAGPVTATAGNGSTFTIDNA
ncbi:MAG: hypothetical protein E8D41_02930, partial [Nitrospira sp.]